MRFLHTADWHLGRQFEGRSLEQDHAAILDQVLAAILTHEPDALIVAGDIFDRTTPPESAVRQLNELLRRVAGETDAAIVLIAGNHDSGDRIGAMAMLADRRRALVRGPLMAEEHPLVLTDAHGPVAISALPFGYEFAARECFASADIRQPADVLRAEIAAARRHVPAGARWVVTAHGFVDGATTSDAERSLSRVVGGIETIPADVFDGAHYVALGHLHRPQIIGSERIRYAGSPLAFGFDEEGSEKSFAIVDLDGAGAITTTLVPFAPPRRVRTLRGSLDDIIAGGQGRASDDFIKVILTDAERRIDPIKRIREHYPNACSLAYERDATPPETKSARPGASALADPAEVVAEFLAFSLGRPPSEAETHIIAAELAAMSAKDAAA